jgi:glutamyl-tRNA synthetase
LPFLLARGLEGLDHERVKQNISLIRERATTFADAADRLDFVFRETPVVDAAAATKFLTPANLAMLRDFADVVGAVELWTAAAIEERVVAWLADRGLQIKDVAQAARVALTGRTASPGLYDVIAILGKERAVARLTSPASPPTSP